MTKPRGQHGYFVLDAVVALAVIGAMSLALVAAAARSHHGSRLLAEKRAATRLAERVLAGEPAATFDGAAIDVTPHADGWSTVTVRYGRATASLTGWRGEP